MTRFRSGEASDSMAAQFGCVACGITVSNARELYAVCQRANRSWEGGELDRVVVGMIAGIPFVLPSGFGPSIEHRTGEDIVVSVPLPVCDQCWKQLDGGPLHSALSIVSQLCFTSGVVALAYLMFDRSRGGDISPIWSLSVFALGLPPYFVADRIRSHWGDRLKEYMSSVPQYESLLDTFPDLELFTRRPAALMGESSGDDGQP